MWTALKWIGYKYQQWARCRFIFYYVYNEAEAVYKSVCRYAMIVLVYVAHPLATVHSLSNLTFYFRQKIRLSHFRCVYYMLDVYVCAASTLHESNVYTTLVQFFRDFPSVLLVTVHVNRSNRNSFQKK